MNFYDWWGRYVHDYTGRNMQHDEAAEAAWEAAWDAAWDAALEVAAKVAAESYVVVPNGQRYNTGDIIATQIRALKRGKMTKGIDMDTNDFRVCLAFDLDLWEDGEKARIRAMAAEHHRALDPQPRQLTPEEWFAQAMRNQSPLAAMQHQLYGYQADWQRNQFGVPVYDAIGNVFAGFWGTR